MTHAEFIEKLGTDAELVEWLNAATGDDSASKDLIRSWKRQQIPWKWRPYLVQLAQQKEVDLPDDFLPGVAA